MKSEVTESQRRVKGKRVLLLLPFILLALLLAGCGEEAEATDLGPNQNLEDAIMQLDGDDDLDEEQVVLCHVPAADPDNPLSIRVDATDVDVHLAHGDYLGLCEGDTEEDVLDDDDFDDEDGDEEYDDDLVIVCHVPPGNPDNEHSIRVGEPAVDAHLAHGDYLGLCEGDTEDDIIDDDDFDDEDGDELVVLCHAPSVNLEEPVSIRVDEADVYDHLAHGDYLGLCEGDTEDDIIADDDFDDDDDGLVILCHVPSADPETHVSISVDEEEVSDHLAHGDYLGLCEGDTEDDIIDDDDFDDDDAVIVCHVPPGNPDNEHTIRIGEPAVDAHLAHGDYLGFCEGDTDEDIVDDDFDDDLDDIDEDDDELDDDDGAKVTVCHVPGGNPRNQHEITIAESAVDAHLGHGDYLGACTEDALPDDDASVGPGNSNNGNPGQGNNRDNPGNGNNKNKNKDNPGRGKGPKK